VLVERAQSKFIHQSLFDHLVHRIPRWWEGQEYQVGFWKMSNGQQILWSLVECLSSQTHRECSSKSSRKEWDSSEHKNSYGCLTWLLDSSIITLIIHTHIFNGNKLQEKKSQQQSLPLTSIPQRSEDNIFSIIFPHTIQKSRKEIKHFLVALWWFDDLQ